MMNQTTKRSFIASIFGMFLFLVIPITCTSLISGCKTKTVPENRIKSTPSNLPISQKDSGLVNSEDSITPFLTKTMTGMTPVLFDTLRKENDSISSICKKEKRCAHDYDTLPSSLTVEYLKVKTENDSLNTLVNTEIIKSIIKFYNQGLGSTQDTLQPSLQAIMDDFETWRNNNIYDNFSASYGTKIVANEKEILSLHLSYWCFAGGANGAESDILVSFDIRTGKQLKLENLFKTGYQHGLCVLAGVPEAETEAGEIIPCTADQVVENGFAITHDGIDLIPLIVGEPSAIHIPYSEMKDILDSNGVLSRFLK